MPDVRPLRSGDPEWIGGHRLVGVLGSGGQGTVYKAVADGGREVAIKLLHSHLSGDGDVTKGFLREVEAARRVAAFTTAAVLEVGMLDERPFIVSEYVPGDTLQQVVRASGPRVGGALDRLAISTLAALTAIHQAGIVHRDFKPGNVLMGPEGPIVIDFGIAKALGATTLHSGPVGTPAYMSPEQFEGRGIGPASDVFSWAGTMVYAATGHPPFAGDRVPVIMNAVLSGAPDLSGLPPHLLDPIRECLAKDPAARPTPADLMQRLIRRTGPTPQPPAPPPPPPPPLSPSPPPGGFPPQAAPPPYPPMRGTEPETSPSGGRLVSRRAVISAAAAAAATAAVSAFVALRPGGGAGPGGDPSSSPSRAALSPSANSGAPTTRPPRTPTPSPSADTFGTQVGKAVTLPAGAGAPRVLSSNGSGVACGTANGTVYAWDLDTAALVRLGDGGSGAPSVAHGLYNGATAVVAGYSDGRMRLWSASGRSLASRRVSDPIVDVAIVGGRPVAVSQKYDGLRDLRGTVRLWDVATGKQIGPTSTDHQQGIHGLAFGWLGDDDVLVTGDGRQNVRVHRLSDGKVTRSFNTGPIGGIELLACGTAGGRPILVSTHLDATLRVYDLATGKRRKKWTFSDQSPDDRGTTVLVTGLLGDVPIAVVAHAPAGGQVIVRVWNLDTGEHLGVLGPGEGGAIRTLAVAELDGRPVIAGAGEDRTLRMWSLGSGF